MKVSFITYGDKTDLQYREQLQGIEILCNRWNIPQPIYESLIPLLHARSLFRASIIKTNQTDGAEVGFTRRTRLAQALYCSLWIYANGMD